MYYTLKTILISLILSLASVPVKSSLIDLSDASSTPPPAVTTTSSLSVEKATAIDLFQMVQREALKDLTATAIEEVNLATEAFTTLVNNSNWNDPTARDFLMKILAFQTGDYQTFRNTYEKYFPKHTSQQLATLIQGKTYVNSLSRAKGGAFCDLEAKKGTYRKLGLMFFPTDFPGVTTLVDVIIRSNSLDHLPDMRPWSHLEKLWIYDNKLSDVDQLSSLQGLVLLALHNNRVSNLTPISQCTSLQELSIGGNPLTSLEPLLQLTKLTQLYACTIVTDTFPFDTNSIKQMTQLRALALDGNNLSSAGFLSGHTRLDMLLLHHNKLTSVESLNKLTALTNLDVDNNLLSSEAVASLTTLHKLEKFSAEQNPGNAFTTLSQLQALRLERLKTPQTVPAPVASKAPSEKTPESTESQYLPKPSSDVAQAFPRTPTHAPQDDEPPAYQASQQVPQGPIKRLGKKLTDLFG